VAVPCRAHAYPAIVPYWCLEKRERSGKDVLSVSLAEIGIVAIGYEAVSIWSVMS
jgi:hypothetical protein